MPMEKTFDAATAEPRITALWQAADAFRAGANAKAGADPYSIMIPPPNVTGSLHMGHAFNNTLQDILIRWHRMRGFDTLWQVGTDHAGIATQMVTEREMAANGEGRRQDMTREDFVARVWQQKAASRGTIIGQLKRLGASCDWSREAFTMSGAPGAPKGEEGNFHDAVIKAFVDLYNKGLIYRGKRLVNWDPHFETAISDLEVENLEVAGQMWHFKYVLAGGETYTYEERDAEGRLTLSEERNYIAIATTRPETMLGDGAVAVHPSDARYAGIVGKMVHLPLCDRLIPIITDEYPDPAFGSGAVKITGAHDFNDYAVAKRAGIPCYRLMDTRAQMRSDGGSYADSVERARAIAAGAEASEAEIDALNLVPKEYRGLDRFEARRAVVADIEALGLSVMTTQSVTDAETGDITITAVPLIEAKPIMQPFGDRSKVVIEPMLTDQWFVDTAQIVEPALEAVRSGATKIIPESGEKTYFHWLENIEPWCISRQLWWGHQIPVWYGPPITSRPGWSARQRALHDKHNRPGGPYHGQQAEFCASSWSDVRKMASEYYGDPEDSFVLLGSIEEFEGFYDRKEFVQKTALVRDPDVLDTWFSSGLWPIGTLGWPEPTPELSKYFPTSTLVTGSDILFFWVARMMMMQLAVLDQSLPLEDRVPFDTVYLHGLVRDAKGKKMSKSLGNVIDPLAIIDEYGADALRFANAAMATLGGTLKLDTQRIAGYRNFGTKLWNAARFAEMNGVWEGHRTGPAPAATATVNRWIIGEAVQTRIAVDVALAAFRFDQAAATLHAFVRGQVCDWYVEFAKPLFDGPQAAETRATMAWVLDQCMILAHPVMPFLTEELWQTTGARDGLLCHAEWPTLGEGMIDATSSREMTWVLSLIDDIRSARTQMNVPPGSVLPILALSLDPQAEAAFAANAGLIGRLARVGDLARADTAPRGALTVPAAGALFAIPLGGVIDVAAEQARLGKALDKLGREIAGMDARLKNPAFAASAPEEVVAETRDTRDVRATEADKLRAALARLAEMA